MQRINAAVNLTKHITQACAAFHSVTRPGFIHPARAFARLAAHFHIILIGNLFLIRVFFLIGTFGIIMNGVGAITAIIVIDVIPSTTIQRVAAFTASKEVFILTALQVIIATFTE